MIIEDRPCVFTRPVFVKVFQKDAHGNPIPGTERWKRIRPATCVEGTVGVHVKRVNGVNQYLCDEHVHEVEGDQVALLGGREPLRREGWAGVPITRDGDDVIVRLTPDTKNLREKLLAAGFEQVKHLTRSTSETGKHTVRVATFRRIAAAPSAQGAVAAANAARIAKRAEAQRRAERERAARAALVPA